MIKPISPFVTTKTQKIFSLISMLIGLLFLFFTVPFIVQFGAIMIIASAIGLILFIMGLIYFLSSVIE